MIFNTKKGHKFIKVNTCQMVGPLGGLAICDRCAKPMTEGRLIPVLNSCYCIECFGDWEKEAEFYDEDISYEDMKTKQFLTVLNRWNELQKQGEKHV